MQKVQIRKATHKDIASIQGIAEEVWPIAYGEILPDGQIPYMLNMMYSEEALTEQMRQGHQFLLAALNGKEIGFCSFGKIDQTLMEEDIKTFKLHKLYVLSSFQGSGVGKLLLKKVVELVQQMEGTHLQLQVNKKNPALYFYEKNGFFKKQEAQFDIGGGYVMDDYIMEFKIPAPPSLAFSS